MSRTKEHYHDEIEKGMRMKPDKRLCWIMILFGISLIIDGLTSFLLDTRPSIETRIHDLIRFYRIAIGMFILFVFS